MIKFDESKTLEDIKLEYIVAALEFYDNDKPRAAEALGITTKSIYNFLQRAGLFDRFRCYSKAEVKQMELERKELERIEIMRKLPKPTLPLGVNIECEQIDRDCAS